MTLIDYSGSILSFVVPIVTIVLAITTGRVVISLFVGAVLGALMLNGFSLDSAAYLGGKLKDIFISDGSLEMWTINIFLFLIFLGSVTGLLALNGSTRAFANWARVRVKSKKGASVFTVFLGIVIFIDDYFNAIGVGAISRPITDEFKVSRAKLAYLLDSTSAPMVILTPISSWGGYVIGILGTVFAAQHIEISALSAYVQMIPMNFYAILTIGLVLYTALTSFNIGAMREHERRAEEEGILYDPNSSIKNNEHEIIEGKNGKVYELFITIFTLVAATIGAIFYTGASALKADSIDFSFVASLENADVALALIFGASAGLFVALIFSILNKNSFSSILNALYKGAMTMKEALIILTVAWLVAAIIKDIHTGAYIASLVNEHLDLAYLPALIFILSAIMAFATGTSWGTFGIMIGITVGIAAQTDPSVVLVLLSAVLSGAVMGDHCSPISDTTILSSIGAQSNHIDHVKTQLPYALIAGFSSLIGFLVLGFSENLGFAWIASLVTIVSIVGFFRMQETKAV
ncbi:Na+/H+ antiporter [hydrothermal vent metagenome]|uniref:Na+/H+ antiporter n=1 Tax=hydrothermal vent metagenome TaxID=652676 RepID=A0A1W1EDN4_9ZZZZ